MLPGLDGKPGLCFTESRPRGSPGNTERSRLFLLHQSEQSHRKHVQMLYPEFMGISRRDCQ